MKRTKEIRKRLREGVLGWLGESAAELVEYGMKPRKPRSGGRKAKNPPVVAVEEPMQS